MFVILSMSEKQVFSSILSVLLNCSIWTEPVVVMDEISLRLLHFRGLRYSRHLFTKFVCKGNLQSSELVRLKRGMLLLYSFKESLKLLVRFHIILTFIAAFATRQNVPFQIELFRFEILSQKAPEGGFRGSGNRQNLTFI